MFTRDKWIKLILCLNLIVCITGCGSLLRAAGSNTYQGTYHAVNNDMGIIGDIGSWYASFGLTPLIAIASLPLDLVVDIVLYPMDYASTDMQYLHDIEGIGEDIEKDFTKRSGGQKRFTPCQSICVCNE